MYQIKKLNIEELFNLAVQNQKKNNLVKAKKIYKEILNHHPKFIAAYNNLGLIYKLEGEYEKAIQCFKKIIKINPDLISAHNNLGIIFQKLGENKKAKDYYEKIIKIDPNFIMAQYNFGLVLKQLGEYEKAISCFKKVIEIDSSIVNAYNSLGATYGDLGRYKEAIDYYIITLKHDNKHKTAKENLISALTFYQSDNDNPIIVTNNLLKKLHKDITNNLEDNNLETFFKKSFKMIDNIKENIHGIDFIETQIYRRNSKNLNCVRHHKVFNHLNIIPKFCFSCFKIQIEPKTVFELIKLFFIFDNFNFPNNNWRKCMIELRPKVQGTYKGFIYCSSMDESKKILHDLSSVLKKSLEYKVSIKRGCSEFYNPFPNFKQTDKDETNFMNFEDSWNEIEKKAGSEIKLDNTVLKKSISGFSISDFLIINHWLNYAKAINDISYKNVSTDFIHSKFVAKKISNQLELRRKQFLC